MNIKELNEELNNILEEFEPYFTIVGQPGSYTYNHTVSDEVGGTWFGDSNSPGYFDTKEDAIEHIKKNYPNAKIVNSEDTAREKYQAQQEIVLAELIDKGIDAVSGDKADEIVIDDKLFNFWKTLNGGYGFAIWSNDKNKIIKAEPTFVKDEVELADAIYNYLSVNESVDMNKVFELDHNIAEIENKLRPIVQKINEIPSGSTLTDEQIKLFRLRDQAEKQLRILKHKRNQALEESVNEENDYREGQIVGDKLSKDYVKIDRIVEPGKQYAVTYPDGTHAILYREEVDDFMHQNIATGIKKESFEKDNQSSTVDDITKEIDKIDEEISKLDGERRVWASYLNDKKSLEKGYFEVDKLKETVSDLERKINIAKENREKLVKERDELLEKLYPYLKNESKQSDDKKESVNEEKDYDYVKFEVDGQAFSKTEYNDGRVYIKSIHPYDNSEYHWAYNSGNGIFIIYINSPGKKVASISGTKEDVAKKLLELDKDTEAQRAIY